jgi:pilus assembly protein Flp/PilA
MMNRKAKKGQSLAEYGLILALIAVVSIIALSTLGQNIRSQFTNLAGHMNTALNQSPGSTGVAGGGGGT